MEIHWKSAGSCDFLDFGFRVSGYLTSGAQGM